MESGANVHDCQVAETVTVSVDPSFIATASISVSSFGGIAGFNDGIINNCISQATVTDQGYSEKVHSLGGIVGENYSRITNCRSLANIIGINLVGGIAGAESWKNGNRQACCHDLKKQGEVTEYLLLGNL